MVRFYEKSDYPMVCEWWKQWGWPAIPESTLPEVGVIYENEVPVCAAWIYRTDSDTCLIEWFISNKSATKAQRTGAIEGLVDACKHIAKQMGFSKAFCSIRNQHLIKKMEGRGFVTADLNMTNMVGEL